MVTADAQLVRSATLTAIKESTVNEDTTEDAEILVAESLQTGYFFSPKHFHQKGLFHGPLGRAKAQRRLLQVYSHLEVEELARSFATAFRGQPALTFLSGIDLCVAAKAECERLVNTDTIRSEEVGELAEKMQRCVSGCLRIFSAREDLVDGLFSTIEGKRRQQTTAGASARG